MATLCSRREICSGQARSMLERFLKHHSTPTAKTPKSPHPKIAHSSASHPSASHPSTDANSPFDYKCHSIISQPTLHNSSQTLGRPAKNSEATIIKRVIAQLIADAFIDDRRFLKAYLKDKIEFAGWGPKKIEKQLQEWNFPQETINKALAENEKELDASLRKILEKKKEQLEKESGKKIGAKRRGLNEKVEKLQNSVNEINKLIEQIKESEKDSSRQRLQLAYKELRRVQQKLQRTKFEESNAENSIKATYRTKLIAHATSKGFALENILSIIRSF